MYVLNNSSNKTVMNTETNETKGTQQFNVSFKHIYNGLIFHKSIYIFTPVLEFKIVQKEEADKVIFKDVNYKCAWFAIDINEEKRQLLGPIKIDTEMIKSGKRIVRDDRFSDIDGCVIDCVSDDQTGLITDEIPKWMISKLMESVADEETENLAYDEQPFDKQN